MAQIWATMMFGRLVFALGNESLAVAQFVFIIRYFRDSWGMSFAFGIQIAFSTLGSSLNFQFSPLVAKDSDVNFSVALGFCACLLSLLATSMLVILDLFAEMKKQIVPKITLRNKKHPDDEDSRGSFKCSDFKSLSREFFYITAVFVLICGAVLPFAEIAARFFEVKYQMSETEGSIAVSHSQFAFSAFAPIFGLIIEKVGHMSKWILASGVAFIIIHLLFLVTTPNIFVINVFVGFCYAFFATSIWPSLVFVVRPEAIGLTIGVVLAFQSMTLAIALLIVGAILDAATIPLSPSGVCANWTKSGFDYREIPSVFPYSSLMGCSNFTNNDMSPLPQLYGFNQVLIYFMSNAAVATVFAVLLMRLNKANDGILCVGPAERRVLFQQRLERWQQQEEMEKMASTPLVVQEGEQSYGTTQEKEESGLLNDEEEEKE